MIKEHLIIFAPEVVLSGRYQGSCQVPSCRANPANTKHFYLHLYDFDPWHICLLLSGLKEADVCAIFVIPQRDHKSGIIMIITASIDV